MKALSASSTRQSVASHTTEYLSRCLASSTPAATDSRATASDDVSSSTSAGILPPTNPKGRTNVVALGITTEGVKIQLGLWEGSTENAAAATALLSDLVDRGLDVGGHRCR